MEHESLDLGVRLQLSGTKIHTVLSPDLHLLALSTGRILHILKWKTHDEAAAMPQVLLFVQIPFLSNWPF